jgi:hypothetical protein
MFNHNLKQLVLAPGTKLLDCFLVFMCHGVQLELKLEIPAKHIRQQPHL